VANITRSLADTAGFIPQMWARRALTILRANMVLAQFVHRDYENEPGWKGKTLNIPYPGTFTAQDKAANSQISVQVPANGNSVAVTLSSHKAVDFNIEDVARAQSSVELMDQYLAPAVIALSNQVEDDLFSLNTSLTGAAVGTLGTDATGATIRAARGSLNGALAPMPGRAFIASAKDEVSILGDSTLQSFFAFRQGNNAVAEGQIGRLYGFDTWMSQRVPVPTVTINLGTQSSGTFTVSYAGQTTPTQAYNVAAATLQTAIQALSTVGSGNATVSGTGPYVITFASALAQNITPMTADFSLLTTPANASIKNGYKNLALYRDAMILAVRPFADEPGLAGVDSFTAQDPDTNLAVRVQRQYSMADRAIRYGVDILYGVAVLRPTLGVVVAS
jgi:P22 coat protein - gene protein 5